MDQQIYIPLQQPIEGLQNTKEMMDNKYDLKNLMENSSIQTSTPEFIKMVDHNLIIDDDDMIFENFPENDVNDITEEEQNLILSAFQSALTGKQSNQSELASNSSNRSQISIPNIKIVKGKMYEIEEPFFKDFDDILPPQPPSYDDHIETIPGSLHRPILPIDTLFPTDDMMYQDGSLVMQNGEKYAFTSHIQKSENKNQDFVNYNYTQSPQTISPLLANAQHNQISNQTIANSPQLQNTPSSSIELPLTQNASLTSTSSFQLPNDSSNSLYLSQQIEQQNSNPYIFDPQQPQETPLSLAASSQQDNPPFLLNQPHQYPSQMKMQNPESGKPLFDITPPFQPPPLIQQNLQQGEEPFYRKIQAQPFVQPTNKETQPSYSPIQTPSYPEIPLVQETTLQKQIIPQQQQQQHQHQPETPNSDSNKQTNENETPKKKNTNKRAEAMPC